MRMKSMCITGLLLSVLSLLVFTSCDVHELPDLPEKVTCYFYLKFETDMSVQHFKYDTRSGKDEAGLDMRYIVRAYPSLENDKRAKEYIEQSIFTRSISNDYDCSFSLELPPGKYNIMVWTDFVEKGSYANYLYNADNFAEIYLHGEHRANTDNRDAFRGSKDISIVTDIVERVPDTTIVEMIRPLGKFEFIATDLKEFVNKEASSIAKRIGQNSSTTTATVNLDDYKVVFFYVGFMPNAYSLFTDKPVDSATGVYFESKLTQMSESEASMGFDYIYVNEKGSVATVIIGLYNRAGEQIGMTVPIEVPVQRSWHTIMQGEYLLQQNNGGVNINPEFDGDHNLHFP